MTEKIIIEIIENKSQNGFLKHQGNEIKYLRIIFLGSRKFNISEAESCV